MCALFAFQHKSSLPCPLYFLHLLHPLLLPTLSPIPKSFYHFNLKSIAFMFPISSPRTSTSFYHRPIIYLSLSFSPETLMAGCFSFHDVKGSGAMCVDTSVLHHKGNAYIRGQVAGFLSLTCGGGNVWRMILSHNEISLIISFPE